MYTYMKFFMCSAYTKHYWLGYTELNGEEDIRQNEKKWRTVMQVKY